MPQLLTTFATLSLVLLCTACTNEYGDRVNAIQLLYLIYETGFSALTNIRVDLVLLIPAMLLSTVLGVYWAQRD